MAVRYEQLLNTKNIPEMNELISSESQTFSFYRFSQLLKSDLRIYRSGYMKIVFAAIGCFLTVAILVSIFAINAKHNLSDVSLAARSISIQLEYVGYYQIASFFMLSLGLTILGSLTFISMNSKEGRIMTIMMPASMLEKFLVRFLLYFVGGLLVLCVGYFVGILELILTFADIDAVFPISNIIGDNQDRESIFGMMVVIGLPLLFGNAFYALGSSVWPRTSWVKTWVVQQILGILFLFMGAFGLFDFIPVLMRYVGNIIEFDYQVFWLYVAVFAVLITTCWVLAWFRFRNTQIVQRFMK